MTDARPVGVGWLGVAGIIVAVDVGGFLFVGGVAGGAFPFVAVRCAFAVVIVGQTALEDGIGVLTVGMLDP